MNRYSRVHAEIDLDAILHNMDAMRGNIAKDTKIMAVIKADGYGHGAVEIAETIEKLDYLYGYAVATVEEGLILRNHGIQKPILILGYVFPDQYVDMIKAGIRPTVFTLHCSEGPDKNACDGYKMWHLLSLSRRERRKAKDIITIVDAIFEDNNFDGILSQKTIRRISGLENRVYSVRELDDIFPD